MAALVSITSIEVSLTGISVSWKIVAGLLVPGRWLLFYYQHRQRGNSPRTPGFEAMRVTRRKLLKAGVGLGLLAPVADLRRAAAAEELPPVRPITTGPRFHWFSYYDKLQFDPTGRYALGMEVSFEHRLPEPNE